ncbi:alpha/beta hydrolase [Kineococcus sp. R86509]|uniref:alpha/beta hydrolase n=1 Tax=Kineococcus sp. R86509 TaxID=3093851 RepID=UPI0036D2F11C
MGTTKPPEPLRDDVSDDALLARLPGFTRAVHDLGEVSLNVVTGGEGPVVVLLPGWPQTWWSFHELMPHLARSYRVLAVDIRGMGGSSRPAGGYDKKTMAGDVHRLLDTLGIDRASVVGHDIGAQVAFSLAANHPTLIERIVMLDFVHFSPEWYSIPLLPAPGAFADQSKAGNDGAYLWWFAFHQVKGLPEALLEGRAHLEHDWFFDYVSLDSASVSVFDRAVYAAAYADADSVRAGNAWYQALDQDVADYESYQPLGVPVLGLGAGAHGLMANLLPARAPQLTLLNVPEAGHFVASENPAFVLEQLDAFLP